MHADHKNATYNRIQSEFIPALAANCTDSAKHQHQGIMSRPGRDAPPGKTEGPSI